MQSRWLYVEDNVDQAAVMSKRLSRVWGEQFPNIAVSIDYERDGEKARNPDHHIPLIESGDYDVVLVDIYFPDRFGKTTDQSPDGLELISRAKALDPPPAVVALSLREPRTGVRHRASRSGADVFYFKGELAANGEYLNDLCSEIFALLHQRGLLDSEQLEIDSKDYASQAVVEHIGSANLYLLYRDAVPKGEQDSKVAMRTLTPGMSGAHVFMTSAHRLAGDFRFLLKVTSQESELRNALENQPSSGYYDHKLVVPFREPLGGVVPHSGDWYALAAEFQADAVPMHVWLNRPSTDVEAVTEALGYLFGAGCLGKGIREVREIDDVPAVDVLLPTVSEAAGILDSLEELSSLIEDKRFGKAVKWDGDSLAIVAFVNDGDVLEHSRESLADSFPGHSGCRGHGDLHCRNILVPIRRSYTPSLIDWNCGDTCLLHWGADWARLAVDLLLSAYDYPTNMHAWTRIASWLAKANGIYNPSTLAARKTTHSIDCALSYMCTVAEQMVNIIMKEHTTTYFELLWQLQLATCVEFLKSSYRPDTPTPKRAFALQAAVRGLHIVSDTVRLARCP